MEAEFSEYSFGFAYTFELSTLWRNHLFAFELPNLNQEGKKGYDLRLASSKGFVYCAQFKRSEYMTKPNANEYQADKLPYFRFPIYGNQQSRQHQLLLDLEKESGFLVEYVAPSFIEIQRLYGFFNNQNLRENVVRICPCIIGKLQDDKKGHTVVYDDQMGTGWGIELCSDRKKLNPQKNGRYDNGEITEDGFSSIPDAEEENGDDSKGNTSTIESLLEMFIEKVTTTILGSPHRSSDFGGRHLNLAQEACAVARILLGAELFIFPRE